MGKSPIDTWHHYVYPDIPYSEHIVDQRFNFPGYIPSGTYYRPTIQLSGIYPIRNILSTDRVPCLHGIGKATLTVSLTKSHKWSLAFNSRRAWWDNHKSSQAAWHSPRVDDYSLRWQKCCLSTPLAIATLHQEGHDCPATLWVAIMTTMGPTSPIEVWTLQSI